jgi:hypothetical protein
LKSIKIKSDGPIYQRRSISGNLKDFNFIKIMNSVKKEDFFVKIMKKMTKELKFFTEFNNKN